MSATATNKAVDTKSQSVRDEELEEIKQLEAKYKVKASDMMPAMLNRAIRVALAECKNSTEPSHIAAALRRDFNTTYGSGWHCVVGHSFGSKVVHISRTFAFFRIGYTKTAGDTQTEGQLHVLLFRAGSA